MVQTPAPAGNHREAHSDGRRSSGGGAEAAKPTKGLRINIANAGQAEKKTPESIVFLYESKKKQENELVL